MTGYTDTGLFGPSDEITREQMVTMLHRFEGSPQVSADLSGYPDSGLVGAWSLAGMQWAVANGIISGDNNMLNPQGITTREVCATIIMRFQGGEYIETESGPRRVRDIHVRERTMYPLNLVDRKFHLQRAQAAIIREEIMLRQKEPRF